MTPSCTPGFDTFMGGMACGDLVPVALSGRAFVCTLHEVCWPDCICVSTTSHP